MWNEPNIEQFWKSPAGRADYIALAKATGQALRDAGLLGEKGEALIGPATSTIDQPFLEGCFKAGLLEFWDAVSVHPYRQTAPETVEEEYRAVRLLIRKYAPQDKTIPVISGEWGYSTAWKDFDEQKQAKCLPRQLLTNIANDVALSIWYDWHDDGRDAKDPEHRFGLVRHEYHPGRDPIYDPKPAYQAMKTLTEQLGEFRFNKSLAFNSNLSRMDRVNGNLSRMDRVMLFEKGEEVRLTAWSYGDTGNVVELPAGNDDMTVVKTDGATGVQKAGQPGNRIGIKYMLAPDPAYLLFKRPNEALRIAAGVNRLPLEWVFDTPGRSPELRIRFRNMTANPWSARPRPVRGWRMESRCCLASKSRPLWNPT